MDIPAFRNGFDGELAKETGEAERPGEWCPSQIPSRTLISTLCCSLSYVHFLARFSACLGLLLEASSQYLMPNGLLIFIHEAS